MQRRPIGVLALGLSLAFAAGARAQAPAPQPVPPPEPNFDVPVPPPGLAAQPVAWPAAAPAEAAAPVVYPVGSEPQPAPSPVRWEGQTAILGSVKLDSATKTVSVTGWVNQTAGPIEVLACGPGGKVHESVFVVALNPLDLQAALLLAGLKAGAPMPEIGQGPPNGSPVDLFVDWQADGATRTARAESFVWNVEANAVVPDAPWTFTGSVVKDGQFKAFAEESFVVTYWDPYAIVNIAQPCGSNDEILSVNTNVVPPYQTPITLRFVPR